ncbi:MAG: hypothetical protein V4508_16895 [Pseudomonadota bacterium]
MQDPQENAALTVDLVRAFAKEVASVTPTWQRAFLRFAKSTGVTEAKASYVGPAGTNILNVLEHKTFFHWVTETAERLFETQKATRPIKVALLVLNADFSYEITYEHEDPQRWTISKLNGGTGVPSGL